MRARVQVLIALALLSAAPAHAGPTCQDRDGHTTKCGVAGAMPVGWTLSDEERLERGLPIPEGPSPETLLSLFCVVGGLFALIALMPAFDGWKPGDWDRQEGDDEEAG